MLYSLFEYTATPYYAFKALLFTGVLCRVLLFSLRAGLSASVAFTAAGIFGLAASPAFSGALWVSDFDLLAQVFILGAFTCFIVIERGDLYEADRVKYFLYQGAMLCWASERRAAQNGSQWRFSFHCC
tara:strand:+ start:119 stop:502 length:384 start_codon:yes stop_codon:yes gene_type:complete